MANVIELRLVRRTYNGLTVLVHVQGQPEQAEEGQEFLFAGGRGGSPAVQKAWEAFEEAVRKNWE